MRTWVLTGLAVLALVLAAGAYHLYVIHDGEEHYRLLLERPTVEEKIEHYDAIFRLPHPWNPYREKAKRWFRENGHEWEFLGKGREPARVN